MKRLKISAITSIFLLIAAPLFAQPGSPIFVGSPPNTQFDLSYKMTSLGWKKELFDDYTNEYRTIGSYKVKGNSLLFKGYNVSTVFMKQGYAQKVSIMLDTYKQTFGVLIDGNTSLLNIDFNELDSFVVLKDSLASSLVPVPAMFVNASIFDKSKKFYVQRLVNGDRYGLYKSYKAEMVPASNDIVQTNLQQFEITSDYYYYNKAARTFKKIKASSSFLSDEFKGNKAALDLLKNASFDKESKQTSLVFFFNALN